MNFLVEPVGCESCYAVYLPEISLQVAAFTVTVFRPTIATMTRREKNHV